MQEENIYYFEKPHERGRICHSLHQKKPIVLVRFNSKLKTAVKGRIMRFQNRFVIKDISPNGISYLRSSNEQLRLDFIGLPIRLVAITDLKNFVGQDKIEILEPDRFEMNERRNNARFKTSELSCGHIHFQKNAPMIQQLTHSYMIQDISEGGTCIVMAKQNPIVGATTPLDCSLNLPAMVPINVAAEVRWKKPEPNEDSDLYGERVRVGLMFKEMTPEMVQRIKEFQHSLTLSEAI